MTLSLVCIAVLAVLVFGLGANVTRLRALRGKHDGNQFPADPSDPLLKAIRAHGNAIEYIPTMMVLFLLVDARAPDWTLAFVVGATAARIVHAAGMLTARTLGKPTPLRNAGALGTYLFGLALAGTVLATL